MTQRNEIYKCKVCGNIVEVIHGAKGELVCCGQPMEKQVAGTTDAATEKHVPVIEKVEGGYKVTVGSVAHPMLEAHYIEWIELITSCGRVQRKYLTPGDAPEATFKCAADKVTAREYCNLHGLWEKEN